MVLPSSRAPCPHPSSPRASCASPGSATAIAGGPSASGCWRWSLIQVVASSVGVKEISSFRLPGTESQRAYDLLAEHFPAAKGDTDQIVYKARTGTLTRHREPRPDPGFAQAGAGAAGRRQRREPVRRGRPADQGRAHRRRHAELQGEHQRHRARRPEGGRRTPPSPRAARPLQVEHGGPGARSCASANSQGPSEGVGVLAAAIVLLFTFGSLVAAGPAADRDAARARLRARRHHPDQPPGRHARLRRPSWRR